MNTSKCIYLHYGQPQCEDGGFCACEEDLAEQEELREFNKAVDARVQAILKRLR